ncbi:MAG: glycosyltransferase family 39 protein, partial [Vicinamibacteria bacterium]
MKGRSTAGIAIGFAAVLGALSLWLFSATPEAIRETLRYAAPRSLDVTFLLLMAGAALSFAEIRDSLPRRNLFLPIAVALLALVAVRSIPPRTHRIYYDEDIYQNVAQNIVWMGRAQMCNEGTIEAGAYRCDASEYNKEPNAHPYLLSLAFRFAGVREGAAHTLNHLVFALGAVSIFWLSSMLFDRASAGFGAALVYVLTPQNLLWSATVAAEPGAASFSVFALAAFVLFCRRPGFRTGLFAASALAFASQFRPESGLVLVAAGVWVLVLERGLFPSRALWGTALLVLALIVPLLAHIW